MLGSIMVRVLVANTYLAPSWRALPHANVGDVIEICAGSYADRVLASGEVALLTDVSTTPDLSPEPVTIPSQGKKKTPRTPQPPQPTVFFDRTSRE